MEGFEEGKDMEAIKQLQDNVTQRGLFTYPRSHSKLVELGLKYRCVQLTAHALNHWARLPGNHSNN